MVITILEISPWLGVAALVVGLGVAALGLVHILPSPTPSPPWNGAPPTSPPQLKYRAEILDGRSALFEGDLYVQTDRREKVGYDFPVTLIICGRANSEDICDSPTEAPVPRTSSQRPIPSHSPITTKIGGQVKVELSAARAGIEIRDLVTPGSGIQPLVSPNDVGTWIWNVRASAPGSYLFTATVTVLAADTGAALTTPTVVWIQVEVEWTSKYVGEKISSGGGSFLTWVGQIVVAIIAAGALGGLIAAARRAPRRLRKWLRGRKEKREAASREKAAEEARAARNAWLAAEARAARARWEEDNAQGVRTREEAPAVDDPGP